MPHIYSLIFFSQLELQAKATDAVFWEPLFHHLLIIVSSSSICLLFWVAVAWSNEIEHMCFIFSIDGWGCVADVISVRCDVRRCLIVKLTGKHTTCHVGWGDLSALAKVIHSMVQRERVPFRPCTHMLTLLIFCQLWVHGCVYIFLCCCIMCRKLIQGCSKCKYRSVATRVWHRLNWDNSGSDSDSSFWFWLLMNFDSVKKQSPKS